MSRCTVDPFGSGVHSDDIVQVWHGSTTPALVCGYHYAYFPELCVPGTETGVSS